MNPTPHQLDQLAIATSANLGILGGGPGTGKTFTIAHLIRQLSGAIGLDQVAVGAPTGKAAVRVSETLAGHGIDLRARTWHSMLRGGIDGGFLYSEGNPLPYKVLIGDEHSMVDTDLQASILRARATGTLTLFVGDVNQLPPVGHGAPLRDLIAAGVPYGELTEIKRNDGGIVAACHAIRKGQQWTCQGNLRLAERQTPEQQIESILNIAEGVRLHNGNVVRDLQIVVPVNDKSPLSRKKLNGILQRELNPRGETATGNPFRIGDKIVNTKNGFVPSVDYDLDDPDTQTNDRGEVYVANGEQGIVIDVQPNLTVAELSAPKRVVKIPRGNQSQESGDDRDKESKTSTGCAWDLAYAISVHKSQGSEWPIVVVVIDEYPGAKMVCSREWIYTAISRAKQECWLVGKKSVADSMCRRQAIRKRKTFLRERLLAELATDQLARI